MSPERSVPQTSFKYLSYAPHEVTIWAKSHANGTKIRIAYLLPIRGLFIMGTEEHIATKKIIKYIKINSRSIR